MSLGKVRCLNRNTGTQSSPHEFAFVEERAERLGMAQIRSSGACSSLGDDEDSVLVSLCVDHS